MTGRSETEIIRDLNYLYSAYRMDSRFDAIRQNSDLVPGEGPMNGHPFLIFVGEAPGKTEALQGRPFIGRAGGLLDKLIAEQLHLDRDDVYITNLVKYWPGQGNPDPSPEEMAAGLEYLRREITVVAGRCRLIVSLGRLAYQAITRPLYGASWTHPIGKAHGTIVGLKGDFKLFPMYHPSWGLRGNTNREVMRRDFDKLRAMMGR